MAKAVWRIVAALGIAGGIASVPVIGHMREEQAKQVALDNSRQEAIKAAYSAYKILKLQTQNARDHHWLVAYEAVDGGLRMDAMPTTQALDDYAIEQKYKIEKMLEVLPDGFALVSTDPYYAEWSGRPLEAVRADVVTAIKEAQTQFVQAVHDVVAGNTPHPTDYDQLNNLIGHTDRALRYLQNGTVDLTSVKGENVTARIIAYNQALNFSMAKLILAEIPSMTSPAHLHHVTLPLKEHLKAAGGLGLSALFPGESLTDDQAYERIRAIADKTEAALPKTAPVDAAAIKAIENTNTR
ncbi:MAG: hypothetical protein EYC62_00555 [Alphaproteobacteria bacterium]|nr:MAG: hypothetical protein EYC62_00555 [Alphaproteobacteria bacterium]